MFTCYKHKVPFHHEEFECPWCDEMEGIIDDKIRWATQEAREEGYSDGYDEGYAAAEEYLI